MSKKMSRRRFTRLTAAGMVSLPFVTKSMSAVPHYSPVRLGAPVFGKYTTPGEWVSLLKKKGYKAAYCPVEPGAPKEVIRAYADEAAKADIVIAETGAWSNPLSEDPETRNAAIKKCIDNLALAEEIGARCCVNISGSRGKQWDGPDPKNLTRETFDMIVDITRTIIDEVKPVRTFFTLEPMPWAYPDSPDSYLELIRAVDRRAFAVHLDVVNMINSPRRYFENTAFIGECFSKLGPYIKSIHAKDIILTSSLTTHLEERRPGNGYLNYAEFLTQVSLLGDVPFMLEHLDKEIEYDEAAAYVRSVAKDNSIPLLTW